MKKMNLLKSKVGKLVFLYEEDDYSSCDACICEDEDECICEDEDLDDPYGTGCGICDCDS